MFNTGFYAFFILLLTSDTKIENGGILEKKGLVTKKSQSLRPKHPLPVYSSLKNLPKKNSDRGVRAVKDAMQLFNEDF
jgi:hypothetical protein